MAAPIPSSIILPDDAANTGKKVRTETRVVSGGVVHEHFYVPTVGFTVNGHYYFSSPQQTVSATDHTGGTSAYFWFQNPLSSTITMILRSIIVDSTAGSVLVTASSALMNFTKGTFTGTATGATLPSVPSMTSSPAAQVTIRTAVTGMIVTKSYSFGAFLAPSMLSAAGTCYGSKVVYPKNPLAYIRGLDLEFAPGECMIVWQNYGGVASDTRKFGVQVEWDEVDLS